LSTLNNYAYHLGNVTEKWMEEEFNLLKTRKSNISTPEICLVKSKPLKKWQRALGKSINRILLSKLLKEKYFELIGLKDGKNY